MDSITNCVLYENHNSTNLINVSGSNISSIDVNYIDLNAVSTTSSGTYYFNGIQTISGTTNNFVSISWYHEPSAKNIGLATDYPKEIIKLLRKKITDEN